MATFLRNSQVITRLVKLENGVLKENGKRLFCSQQFGKDKE